MKNLAVLLFLFLNLSVFGYEWEQKTDFGGVARHRTTALAIGNKVYFGLGHYNGAGPNILFEDWWEYDPGTNAWTQKANYMGGPTYHASSFTIGNIGYVGTGRIPSTALVSEFYSFDPTTNSWTQLQNFPGTGRRGGVGFAIDGYGYLGTGSYNSDFYKYDPVSGNWTQISSMPTGGRISSVGFSIEGYGYVGTGSIAGATNDFWRYNPATDQWDQMADVGPIPRQEASGFTVNGRGYILTGDDFSSGNNFGDMWEYLPTTNQWVQMDDFPGSSRRYLSCITLGNIAYAGLGTNGTNFKDFWAFDQLAYILEKNLDNIEITAFPNPTTEYVTFKFNGLENIPLNDIRLSITSMTGQEVFLQALESTKMTVEATKFEKGIYIYSMVYSNKVLKTGKLIIN